MIAKLVMTVAALTFVASAAEARHIKRHKVMRHGPAYVYVPAPYHAAGPRPVWGAPQQCFTDEGYGRYWPCGAGPSTR